MPSRLDRCLVGYVVALAVALGVVEHGPAFAAAVGTLGLVLASLLAPAGKRVLLGLVVAAALAGSGYQSWLLRRRDDGDEPRRIEDYRSAGPGPEHWRHGIELTLLVLDALAVCGLMGLGVSLRRPQWRSEAPVLTCAGLAAVATVAGSLVRVRTSYGVIPARTGHIATSAVVTSLEFHLTTELAIVGATGLLALMSTFLVQGRRAVLAAALVAIVVFGTMQVVNVHARPTGVGFFGYGQTVVIGRRSTPLLSAAAVDLVVVVMLLLLGASLQRTQPSRLST